MHRDLRVVGAGLDAEIPVGLVRVQIVGRKVRQTPQGGGLPAREAEAILARLPEQAGTETEGDRQAGRRQTDGLAGVVGRRAVGTRGRSEVPGAQALGHPRGRDGPVLQQLDQLVARARGDVERGEVQPILRRCDDPGLVGAVERVRGGRGSGLGRRRRLLRGGESAGRPGRDAGYADAGGA